MVNVILRLSDNKADVMEVVVVPPEETKLDDCFPNSIPAASQRVNYQGGAKLCFCLIILHVMNGVKIIIIFHFVNFKTFDILSSQVSFIVQKKNKPVRFLLHIPDFLSKNRPVSPCLQTFFLVVVNIIFCSRLNVNF